MKEEINILVLGVGGNVSQGIITALRHSNIKCRIVGACVSEESLGLYFCDKSYISPYASDSNFIQWVSDVCKNDKIDIVLSGVEENLMALERNRDVLEAMGIPFYNTAIELLNIGNDKLATCQWLKEKSLNYPKFADSSDRAQIQQLIDDVGFPLIAKPIKGKGSSGIKIISNQDDIQDVPKDSYIIQEMLGNENEEYTVGCYIDKNGNLAGMIIMQRWLKHGTTFKAKIVENEAIRTECEKICKAFKAAGPLNIQLRMHNGKPTCFELNVRFSGTTPLRANWGFNDVEAFIREYLSGEPVKLTPNKTGIAYRYYNEAYVDEEMTDNLKTYGHIDNVCDYKNIKESL